MSKRGLATALAGVMATVFTGAALAAEETPGEVPITKDLTAVIALQGLPCGKVVSVAQQDTVGERPATVDGDPVARAHPSRPSG